MLKHKVQYGNNYQMDQQKYEIKGWNDINENLIAQKNLLKIFQSKILVPHVQYKNKQKKKKLNTLPTIIKNINIIKQKNLQQHNNVCTIQSSDKYQPISDQFKVKSYQNNIELLSLPHQPTLLSSKSNRNLELISQKSLKNKSKKLSLTSARKQHHSSLLKHSQSKQHQKQCLKNLQKLVNAKHQRISSLTILPKNTDLFGIHELSQRQKKFIKNQNDKQKKWMKCHKIQQKAQPKKINLHQLSWGIKKNSEDQQKQSKTKKIQQGYCCKMLQKLIQKRKLRSQLCLQVKQARNQIIGYFIDDHLRSQLQ